MYRVETAYPRLRESLAPEFIEVADSAMDAIVAEAYGPGMSAEMAESFWNDLGRGFKQALPGVVQGAATGSALGPWGALAGAVAGGAGSLMSQSRDPTVRNIGGGIGGVMNLAGGLTGRGGGGGGGGFGNIVGALGGALGGQRGAPVPQQGLQQGMQQPGGQQLAGLLGGQGGSANALLGLLSRPETLQALSAAVMGRFGRGQVPVGQQQVPVQSILGAMGTLAGHAAHESESATEQLPAYFYGADGEVAYDAADSEQRALALLELYATTPSPWHESQETADSNEAEYNEGFNDAIYTDRDAFNDAWLLANEWSHGQEAYDA